MAMKSYSPLPPLAVNGRGFTLVEVMVAMVIGMLGLIIMMQVFAAAEGHGRWILRRRGHRACQQHDDEQTGSQEYSNDCWLHSAPILTQFTPPFRDRGVNRAYNERDNPGDLYTLKGNPHTPAYALKNSCNLRNLWLPFFTKESNA